MPTATANLLALLELLQSWPVVTGAEIADHLGVDRRTVRRYVATLQGMGIPVEGARGTGGGYRLGAGYRLPPLMFGEDEAAAVTLGLTTARRLGLGEPVVADRALAKVLRVLPPALRHRVEALEKSLGFTSPAGAARPAVPAPTLLTLADAAQRHRRVTCAYRSFSGERSERELSPYGLVVHAGHWYLAAHDHTRDAARTFRVDRIAGLAVADAPATPAPEGFAAAEHVAGSMARIPWRWEVEVRLDLPLERARRRGAATLGETAADGDGTLLRMRVDSLDWMASVLAGFDCPFVVHRPEELRESVRGLAGRLEGWAAA